MKLFDACMLFLDTPLGFLLVSLGIIGIGILIYSLQMPLKVKCNCPQYDLQTQDGTGWIRKTYHREDCENYDD